ncbi:MAG: hypothetical protein Q4D38_11800 [Planctomycetia bacterium]|nr:hypothetical protein [Planctomycetia bacterium]
MKLQNTNAVFIIALLVVSFVALWGMKSFAQAQEQDAQGQNTQESSPQQDRPDYLGPEELLFLGEDTIAILQRDAQRLDLFSLATQKMSRTLALPQMPNRFILKEEKLFISCGDFEGCVVEVSVESWQITRRWLGIHSPWGVAFSEKEQKLYVSRRFHSDILILDASKETGAEGIFFEECLLKTLPAVREPIAMIMTPDETEIYVANLIPLDRSNGPTVASSITILDVQKETTRQLHLTDGVNNLRDITITPDGRYVLGVHTHGNHRTITSQLFGGWTNRNGLVIIDRVEKNGVCVYLLDDLQMGLPNPWSVRVSPDGKLVAITIGGSREVVFLAVEELVQKMRRDMNWVNPGYSFFFGVGSLTQVMSRVRVPELQAAHGLAMSDKYTVVSGYFSDNLAIIPRCDKPERMQFSPMSGRKYNQAPAYTELDAVVMRVGPEPILNPIRRGEIYFYDGELSVEHWHSCVTCHPDARVDGMNWDLLNDGAQNHKNTKSMLYAHATPPCMITGVRPSGEIATRAGYIHIHFLPMDEARYCDVDAYLKALRPIPGIRLQRDGTLSESARRGKRLFFSARTGCYTCHHGEYYTDMKLHDVASTNEFDMHDEFDTPTLIETYRTAPYLHDGRYLTLEELLYEGYHGDPQRRLDKLNAEEKADLVEYLLSL